VARHSKELDLSKKNRTLLVLTVSITLGYLPWYNFSAVLKYLADEFQLTASDTGWILAAFQAGYVVVVGATGWLGDRVSLKKIVFWATLIASGPGSRNVAEVTSLMSMLERTLQRYPIQRVVVVTDRGLLSLDNLSEVARVARSEGIEAAMLGPWASNPLFAYSFTKPGIRDVAMVINRDFPGAEYLATQRDRVEREWTVPERLSEVEVPTSIIAGDHETPGFRAYAEEAAAGIPGARLEFFQGCGHLLPLEEPDRVARTIIEVVQLATG